MQTTQPIKYYLFQLYIYNHIQTNIITITMEIFYIAVLIIAVFFLIIILTTLGLLMKAKNNAVSFPPSKSTCPDYWEVAYDAAETNKEHPKCKVPTTINKGNLSPTILSGATTKGYDSQASTINFDDAGWAEFPGKTKQCAIHDWAVTNEIVWDGVSNFNGC